MLVQKWDKNSHAVTAITAQQSKLLLFKESVHLEDMEDMEDKH